jgi:protein gp37
VSSNSKIEWTETTWNPTTGCDRISAGCDHCYALTLARRLKAMGSAKYQNDGDPRTSGPGFGLTLHPGTLDAPLHWREPRRVFVNSMSDLFHARVPLEFVRAVFAVMAATPQHTYQVLTKRAARLPRIAAKLDWPPNLWMGVSIETDEHAGRAGGLRQVPAAVRFLSCEPLLGDLPSLSLDGIHWVIIGGESGTGARPMMLAWAWRLIRECEDREIPVFVKQVGTVAAAEMRPYAAKSKGGDWDDWPEWLRIRQFPAAAGLAGAA